MEEKEVELSNIGMVVQVKEMLQKEISIEKRDELKKKLEELIKYSLRDEYEKIVEILKYYIDMSEENYTIIALWIIGTYFHDTFLTFPYLFFNAMRGSAKTRTLRLIRHLAKDGDMLASLSEAVLFRTQGSLCIDEFERIDSKEKNALRELLNTAYKKGGMVKRMRKKHTMEGDSQIVESFDTFRPICMANISGMEEVLGDRCISLILEKSDSAAYVKKVEDFEWNENISKVRFNLIQCRLCSDVVTRNLYMEWNKYISYTTSLPHLTTLNDTIPHFENEDFFCKINSTEITGRYLELFFPLILIAQQLNILDEFLLIIKKMVQTRKIDEITESKDVMLYQFISLQDSDWVSVKQLTTLFRDFCQEEQSEDPWLNPKWMGKALKRLNLYTEKRRIGDVGAQVKLNIQKAQTKFKIFQ